MNLSFAGCGFLGVYHIGVACCFKQYAPHILVDKIAGASAGAIAACCLLCDLPIGGMISDVLRVIRDARKKTLGPFSPSFDVQGLLREGLEKFLPEDAHKRVSGKLRVSLTRVYDGKNVIITDFETREELLQALLASAFVPIFSGFIPPKFRGVRYMDGGFSDNLPTLDENTITVSPFCGESDICPRDLSSQLFHVNVANTSIELSKQNFYRIARILFPPKPETLSKMCKQGFDDALKFLQRNNLINCTSCLAVQSTYVVSESLDDSCEFDPECHECKLHRQEALIKAKVPDTVMSVFQEAIDAANKGLVNWIFKHKGMKLLSVLSLPYIVSFDLVCATFTKLISCGPWVGDNLQSAVQAILNNLSAVIKRFDKHRQEISPSIMCQLAVTQYGDFNLDVNTYQETIKNQVINFTVDLEDDLSKLDDELSDPLKSIGNKILSRRSSVIIHKTESNNENVEETFDQILKVTSHHDAVMAFYYMDENNQVKVTEIFDVTKAESEAIFHETHGESRPLISCWESDFASIKKEEREDGKSLSEFSGTSGDGDIENAVIFSDPESEWSSSLAKEKATSSNSDTRPESDQSGKNTVSVS
ncbi:hypothetical protein RUM43_006693 [Polyplax serrata]|uniref:triacylglycerol lipase n=1 Tax=Polyplax serrata TaxID=468196 RepID=A0AAN8S5L8_POLSC